jgi:hypothetical protein
MGSDTSGVREELEAACAKVRRQIEVQRESSAWLALNNQGRRDSLVAELEAELAKLEAALAELDPD